MSTPRLDANSPAPEASLEALQRQLEADAKERSREDYWRRIFDAQARGKEHDTAYGRWTIRNLVQDLTKAIDAYRDKYRKGKFQKRSTSAKLLDGIPSEVAAYITLRVIVSMLTRRERPLVTIARLIGTSICDEACIEAFKKAEPDLFKLTERKVKKERRSRDHVYARKIYSVMASRAGIDLTSWSSTERCHIGATLVELLASSTGLVDLSLGYQRNRKKIWRVDPTPEALEMVERLAKRGELLTFAPNIPMVCRPRPWTNLHDGGYLNDDFAYPLIKGIDRKKDGQTYANDLSRQDLSQVLSAVNAMQNTAWHINKPVLDVMLEAIDRGVSIGKLPSKEIQPQPVKHPVLAEGDDLMAAWKEAGDTASQQAWRETHTDLITERRQEMTAWWGSERRRVSQFIQAHTDVSTAQGYSGYDAIYFPWQLDFRGRAYAVTSGLNPQGSDLTKSLLEFANGKPLTNDNNGIFWLAVHIANCFGFDKVSFEEREAWVLDRSEELRMFALDPFSSRSLWEEAEKPWMFLAACIEWHNALSHGVGYVSHLPITMDGTCNGLQHYSAMLRDEVGAKAVNLTPNERPADIYAQVADLVTIELGKRKEKEPEARQWLALRVDRKITKRSVMTLPYSATTYASRGFIEAAAREKAERTGFNPFEATFIGANGGEVKTDGMFKASLYLQPIVWEAIGQVVSSAITVQKWLSKAARVALGGTQGGLRWHLPDGFVVEQSYRKKDIGLIKTKLMGAVTQLRVADDVEALDLKANARAVPPNFVHSYDACALRMYVNLAYKCGIREFAMVHDSYGSLAADVEQMRVAIQESFVDLYEEGDRLIDVSYDLGAATSSKPTAFPKLPKRGSFRIEDILQSEFFFA